jgi:cytochrome c-type biogenesis protein CcmH
MRRVARKTTAIGLLGLSLAGTAYADAQTPAKPAHVAALPLSFTDFVPGAQRLEGRLLAPCCWDSSRQTLDIHGSPIANELRTEIRSRLKAGDTPDAIEADLVRRYTTKILAAPTDDRIPRMGFLLVVALGGAFVFAATRVAKWRRQTEPAASAGAAQPASGGGAKPGAPDEWDAQIDSELEDRD